ncbi:MAG: DUF2917 domain-containing protein [Burkholderiaceae bacterium]|nr:DUF2917 domain-containing protein [Burkholderiaceae bacterium]
MYTNEIAQAARTLSKDALMRIRKGRGQVVTVLEGLVWITQDAQPHDTFLTDGESLQLEGSHLTVVQALQDSLLIVLAPPPEVVVPHAQRERLGERAAPALSQGSASMRSRLAKRAAATTSIETSDGLN